MPKGPHKLQETLLEPTRQPDMPLLKWVGGKRWILPHLEPLWASYKERTLIELFAGGLAVALGLRPRRAILNDLNPHLINFYRYVQRGLEVKIPLVYNQEVYYRYRDRFNELIRKGEWDTEEAAVLFYYLNRTGYNGLCRFNAKGEFNVPFGRYKNVQYLLDFSPYKEVFQGWEFRAGDFAQVELEPGAFIYADPPYDVKFTQYNPGGFNWEDQVRLVEFLEGHQGPIVISNQATERIVELYTRFGYTLKVLKGPRRISCTGSREWVSEVLAFKGL